MARTACAACEEFETTTRGRQHRSTAVDFSSRSAAADWCRRRRRCRRRQHHQAAARRPALWRVAPTWGARRGAPPPPTSSPIHDGRRGRPTNLSAGGCPVAREPPSFAGYCATGRAGRLNAGPRRTHSGPPRCIRCGDAPAAHLARRCKGSRTYLQRSRATPAHPRSLAGEPFFLPKRDAQKQSYPIPLSRATESA